MSLADLNSLKPGFVKVVFRFESPVLEEETEEILWAKETGEAKFRLEELSSLGLPLSLGDEFSARQDKETNAWIFDDFLESSGASVLLIAVLDEEEDMDALRMRFTDLGCTSKVINPQFFALGIPADLPLISVTEVLVEKAEAGKLGYAEANVSEKHLGEV